MDTGHIAQSSIQWAHHCPALCRQGRPNFLGQLSSCQLPTPFQHGGGGRHPTVWTKRGPRYAPTRAMELFARQQSRAEWSSLEERTWSILRHIPKPGAPTPVRGRTPETLWGLPHLDQAAQTQLDDDSILILRQIYITSLASASRAAVSLPGPRSFLEHPEDPVVSSSLPKAKECSSFWITEEGQLWMEENSLTAISFDQCRLGQLVKKATTLATDLPIQDWDQMRCTHQSHVGTNESSTLSRYPWDMMAGLAKAIAVSLAAPGHIRIPSQFPGNLREPPKGRGSDPPEGHPPRGKRGPSQGGGPSSSHQGSKPGGKNAPKPRLHGQFHPEADTVSPRGTMNPDFPSPMPPMAGDAEQLRKEGQGDQVLDRPEWLPAFRVPHLTDRVAIVQL